MSLYNVALLLEVGMNKNSNRVSISTAPLTALFGKPYYDLDTTIEVVQLLKTTVDGVEFQNLAEWDSTGPPRDDPENERVFAWHRSKKYTRTEIQSVIQDAHINVFSVHANRDVGILLCSEDEDDTRRGKNLMHASLSLAQTLGAGICVFHFWDPSKSDLDMGHLLRIYNEITASYPTVKAAVENIPCNYQTPFELASHFRWVTLDIRWATKYDELEKFENVRNIVNIHLRGELYGEQWVLNDAPYGFYEVIDLLRNWGYTGLFTVEPEGGLKNKSLQGLATALSFLKKA